MTKKIMTAEQAFNVAINVYPSLYNDSTLESAKIKFYNQIFNVVGNGYRDINEFLMGHTITPKNEHLIHSFPDKYITDKPLYYAYTEVEDTYGFRRNKFESQIKGIYTEEELKAMPEVKGTTQCNLKRNASNMFVPYPNFQKQYSMVWEDFSKLDKTWIEAAIVFYGYCSQFFNSDNAYTYHYACPKDDNDPKWTKLISDYETNFQKYKKENQTTEEFNAIVSKEYGAEYSGDTKLFIKNRWNKELNRIKEFLDETKEKLDGLLISKDNEDVKINKPKLK